MATTQSRVVELQIKLQGVKSLEELEQVTSEINDDLKQIDINSKEFTKMGALAQKANSRIKEIDSSLEGITSTEKSEAVNKMGMALLGAFQGAAGASLLFGEQTSEELDKVIKQVGGLFAITDSVKKITEAFSAKNIAGLKAVVAGWKDSALAAKLFGTTTRAALTATGIGLFLVALGTVAANWEKISKYIGLAGSDAKNATKFIEESGKALDNYSKTASNLDEINKSRLESEQQLGKAVKNTKEIARVNADIAEDELTKLNLRIEGVKQYNRELEDKLAKEEYGSEIEKKSILTLLRSNDTLIKQLETSKKIVELKINEAQNTVLISDYLDKQNESLENNQNTLTRISAEENSQAKQYKVKRDILYDQLSILNVQIRNNVGNTVELKKQAEELRAQIDALDTAEKIRLKQEAIEKKLLQDEYQMLQYQREIANTLNEITLQYAEVNNETIDEVNKLQATSDVLDAKISKLEYMKGLLKPTEIEKEFQLEVAINDLKVEKLKNQNEMISLQKSLVGSQISEKEILRTNVNSQLDFYEAKLKSAKLTLQEAKTDEERNTALSNVVEIESTINGLKSESIGYGTEIIGLRAQEVKLTQDIVNNTEQINQINAETNKKIDTQLKGYKKAQDFVAKYAEEINAIRDLTSASFDFYIAQQERAAEMEMRNLEKIQAQREDYAAQTDELNALLADAEGERYNDILAQLQDVEAEKELQRQKEIESIDKINAYQKRAAIARKAQAVIDATIQTSLAVVEALPNLFLAALVGALGAVQIGTILSQPNPPEVPKPEFALGGMLEGKSHAMGGIPIEAEGGEYIVNRKSTGMYLPLLEAINNQGKKFANGGSVSTSTPVQSASQSIIDYRQVGFEVANALKTSPIFVSVTEFRDVENRLKVVESRSSLGKK